MMNILISGDYLYKVAPWLAWNEILYGLNNGYINSKGVVEYAFLGLDATSSLDETELASLSETEFYQVPNILKRLATDGNSQSISMDTWLYLLLSWVYDHRGCFDDPFEVVEEIYSDFNYPENICSIVRYMPLPDGEIGGDEYLYENWLKVISSYKQRLEGLRDGSSS